MGSVFLELTFVSQTSLSHEVSFIISLDWLFLKNNNLFYWYHEDSMIDTYTVASLAIVYHSLYSIRLKEELMQSLDY